MSRLKELYKKLIQYRPSPLTENAIIGENLQALRLIAGLSVFSAIVFLIISCYHKAYSSTLYRAVNILTLIASIIFLILIDRFKKGRQRRLRRFHAGMLAYIVWLTIFGAVGSFFDSLNGGGLFVFITTQVWIYDLLLIPPYLSTVMCGLSFSLFMIGVTPVLHFSVLRILETGLFFISVVAVSFFHYRSAYRRFKKDEKIIKDNYRLNKMSTTDELTDVRNRTGLRLDFDHLKCQYLYVAMCDIDHFKKYNDIYGHSAGDMVLNKFALALSQAFGNDHVYRYGGDEFLVILALPENSEPVFRNKVMQANYFYRQMDFEGIETPTASFGYSYGQCRHAAELRAMIKAADIELYKAKTGGRNQVRGNMFQDVVPHEAAE